MSMFTKMETGGDNAQEKEPVQNRIKQLFNKVKDLFAKTDSKMEKGFTDPEELRMIADEMMRKAEDLKKMAIEVETVNNAHEEAIEDTKMHEEAIEMNKTFDNNKAADEAVLEKAKIAEEMRVQAETEAAELARVRAALIGEGAEAPAVQESAEPAVVENGAVENAELVAEVNENRRHDWENDPEFEDLKNVFSEFHKPSDYNEEVDKNWEGLSKKVFSRLKTTEDFKEVTHFLKGEKNAAYKKWDELTEQEIKEASSEDDMKRALKNMNPVIGRSKSEELRGIAYNKFPSLREYFMNREPSFLYLKDALRWEEGVVEKGRKRLADLEISGQQASEEYKKLHRLLVKTVDGKPVLKSDNEIPDRVAVNDVLNGE